MLKGRLGYLGLGTLVFLLTAYLLHCFVPFVEHAFYDLNFAWKRNRPTDEVVIVGIDHGSVNEIGSWPWRRSTTARLVEQIASLSPSVIAMDFEFQKREADPDDDSLEAVLSRVPHLVLPFKAGAITSEPSNSPAFIPIEALGYRFAMLNNKEDLHFLPLYCTNEVFAGDRRFMQHTSRSGFLNVSTNRVSQKLREVIHVLRLGDHYFPSFAIAVAAEHLGLRPQNLILDGKGKIILGDKVFPISTYAATAFVNFRGRPGTVKTIPAAGLLRGEVKQEEIAGKVVFVGVTDPISAADFFLTPVGPQFPGVEVWATSTLDILAGTWIKKEKGVVAALQWLLALLIFPGLAALLPDDKRRLAMAGAMGMVAVSVVAGVILFQTSGNFWNPGYHVYAWLFCLVWFSVKKPVVERVEAVSLDLDQPPDADTDSLPPPREKDYITRIPSTTTAEYVAKKVEESAPLLSIGLDRAGREGAEAEEEDLLAEVSKLADGRILRPLGSGGMADVYLIWNPRMEVYRAVKVLKPDQPPHILDRFETEIRIFANLNHPNIVQCYSVGDWHGLPALEMEFVHGVALDRVLRKIGALSSPEAAAIAVLVARALHYAHTQVVTVYGKTYRGVIHRDLKPANIILSRGGRIKLTDFGIARPVSVSLHTMDQSRVVGTLPYLAPEQCAAKEVTARTDVYALGETMYEMVSNKRAFPQEDVMTCATAKGKGEYEPLADVAEVPRAFANIVKKAMAVKPSGRYETAESMCHEIEALLRTQVKGSESSQILPRLASRYWA